MEITIENTSSPGAHFSNNTNSVILKCFDWLEEHEDKDYKFADFRKAAAEEKGFNDNNARNIFPLLNNCGFIKYESGGTICRNTFFTNTGQAYVKTLKSIELIENSNEVEKNNIIKELEKIQINLKKKGLANLLAQNTNYREEFIAILEFLLKHKKISKEEFAYLIFIKNKSANNYLDTTDTFIKEYREGNKSLEVKVSIRNDDKTKTETGEDRRIEDITYLTSYSYITTFLRQCNVLNKDEKGYLKLNSDEIEYVEKLIESGGVNE